MNNYGRVVNLQTLPCARVLVYIYIIVCFYCESSVFVSSRESVPTTRPTMFTRNYSILRLVFFVEYI